MIIIIFAILRESLHLLSTIPQILKLTTNVHTEFL